MPENTDRQPAIFLPHGGGPCFFMDWTWGPADTWNATQRLLEGLEATLPAPPRAMVVVSGHWEEPAFTASAAPRGPQLISTIPDSLNTPTGSPGPQPGIAGVGHACVCPA